MLNIYIGWDQRESIAWHVLAHSILTRASEPVTLIPLRQDTLRQCGLYWREPDTLASTEFSLTRFLVPHLSNYEGYSLFLDCDMLCRMDIAILFSYAYQDTSKAVWVAPHDYIPKAATKMDGKVQAAYPRKNWSSAMLFNNARCRMLTPQYVNRVAPHVLHRFSWVEDENLIGGMQLECNWLVGEYQDNPQAAILHYTNGGPWFRNIPIDAHGEQWVKEYYSIVDRQPHFTTVST
jgi:hypothetical protein